MPGVGAFDPEGAVSGVGGFMYCTQQIFPYSQFELLAVRQLSADQILQI